MFDWIAIFLGAFFSTITSTPDNKLLAFAHNISMAVLGVATLEFFRSLFKSDVHGVAPNQLTLDFHQPQESEPVVMIPRLEKERETFVSMSFSPFKQKLDRLMY